MSAASWFFAVQRAMHRRWLTADALSVLRVLAATIEAGKPNPTHRELAKKSGMSRSTVLRTLILARLAGFVSWERVIRWTPLGGRRCANVYSLLLPKAVPPRPKPPKSQAESVTGKKVRKISEAIETAVTKSLAEVTRVMEARLLEKWMTRGRSHITQPGVARGVAQVA